MTDDLVVLAGGAGSVLGAGEDTYEVVRVTEGMEARVGDGFLAARRRDHAALSLGQGRVLLIGGRSDAGASVLADAELLEVRADGSSAQSRSVAHLSSPCSNPRAFRLDDGSVVVAGGTGADGEPVTAVEQLDASSFAVSTLGAFPGRLDAAYAALPGARIAQLGGRDDGGWSGDVEVLLAKSGEVVSLGAVLPPLESPVATALRDGRVVVIGRDPTDRRARGVVLDVGNRTSSAIDPSRGPVALVPLADGSVAEGDGEGLSLLRIGIVTPFDAPPATLAPALLEDRQRLALDAPGRWQGENGALVAMADGARFDVPALRFAAFDLTLEASGEIEVLLVEDDALPVVITTGSDWVSLGDCQADRAQAARLHLVRDGNRLTLDAGNGAVDCPVTLPAHVGVAFRAASGSSVRTIALSRR